MSSVTSRKASGSATLADFLAIPEDARHHELIDGVLIEKDATPSGEHGGSQADVLGRLYGPFQRRSGSGGPGGWWFATEVEVQFGPQVLRPDVLGWRRERTERRPAGTPVTLLPDWACEIL